MLETVLDCRLEMLAKRVSRIEERCQVEAEAFLQKSSSAEQLSAKLHEVSEALQQKADSKALENINVQLHMLRDVITEAVGQVHALSAQLEQPRPWLFCGRRARPQAKAGGKTAGAQGKSLGGTQAESLIQWLEKTQLGDWPLTSASWPNTGAGGEPRSCEAASPGGGGPGLELPLRAGADRRRNSKDLTPRTSEGPAASSPVSAVSSQPAPATSSQPAPEAAAEAAQDAATPAEERSPLQAAERLPEAERLNDRSVELPPEEILRAVLSVEAMCREQCEGSTSSANSGLAVELLVDEPMVRYCMCSSLESATVISVLSTTFPDIFLEDAIRALTCKEELDLWNGQGEFKVLQEAREDDSRQEHVVHYALKAPWPFWDRDILQRRWRLPLPGENGSGEGCAVVMRSVSSGRSDLMPEQQGVVRAFVYGAAFLLRPIHEGASKGTQLTYLTQIDIGGLCPAWAQSLLMRIASRGVVEWSQKLSAHCTAIRGRRQPS